MRIIAVDVSGTDEVRAKLRRIGPELARLALASTVVQVEDYVEQEVGKHSKTGALFQSIYKREVADGWEVGHDPQRAAHAVFVHWGTRPHRIEPKDKKALRWAAGNRFAFAKGVNHPGYKGDPWLVRAAQLAPAIFRRHVERHLDNLMR